jgi:hypothetical protein
MRGRRDLDKCVARFVQREQARILDLEEGAVQFEGFDPLQSGDPGKGAQIAQALFDRFKAETLSVGGVEGHWNWPKTPRGRRDQSDPRPSDAEWAALNAIRDYRRWRKAPVVSPRIVKYSPPKRVVHNYLNDIQP